MMILSRRDSPLSTTLLRSSALVCHMTSKCSWAARFASSVRASHGQVAMLERIPQENVERAITALEE